MYWAPNLTELDFRHCMWCARRQWKQLLNVDTGGCWVWVCFTEQYIICTQSLLLWRALSWRLVCTELHQLQQGKRSYELPSIINLCGLAAPGHFTVLLSHYLLHFPMSFWVECNLLISIHLRKGWSSVSKVKCQSQRGGSGEKVELTWHRVDCSVCFAWLSPYSFCSSERFLDKCNFKDSILNQQLKCLSLSVYVNIFSLFS